MKRLQVTIDEELDEALRAEAVKQRTSKAALIRRFVKEGLCSGERRDFIAPLIGDIDAEPGDIDGVVYRP